jgi:hypothetical protein
MVMVKCPQTGRAIPTGIKTDRESFRRSPVFFARTRCPLCHTDHAWFAPEAWVSQRGLPGLIVHTAHRRSRWRDTMAHMQISTEMSTWRLQAKDFLVQARRLKPGPARNELRQVAKVLRELAKLEAQSKSALDFDRPERA